MDSICEYSDVRPHSCLHISGLGWFLKTGTGAGDKILAVNIDSGEVDPKRHHLSVGKAKEGVITGVLTWDKFRECAAGRRELKRMSWLADTVIIVSCVAAILLICMLLLPSI